MGTLTSIDEIYNDAPIQGSTALSTLRSGTSFGQGMLRFQSQRVDENRALFGAVGESQALGGKLQARTVEEH